MPKLPRISAKQLIRAFETMGYRVVGQKGSHIKLRDNAGRTVVIPNHPIIKPGTLKKGILNPLDISVEELIKHL